MDDLINNERVGIDKIIKSRGKYSSGKHKHARSATRKIEENEI